MKFRVNKGQQIPQFRGLEGGGSERVVLKENDEVEGPPWWAQEFAGRVTPLDEDGNPVDARELQLLSGDLATAKAHERVGILREMIEKNPAIAKALEPELQQAEEDAQAAQDEFQEKQAAKQQQPGGGGKTAPVRKIGDDASPSPAQPQAKPAASEVKGA